ncbi:neprilysin-1-like [Paramacrobiotus metropolitanus]|uniref:neprilysin-1-like n=1 Tax=Paramacrobiotus metropolitanus TaxID=2943436 RepID=UPI002445CC32|nr:neprilysin-1-like [Paramacrobiotus metropolitanus]
MAVRATLHQDSQESMPLSERALLDATSMVDDDPNTCTTNLKTPSTNTICCPDTQSTLDNPTDADLNNGSTWTPKYANPARIEFHMRRHSKRQTKCWNYLSRHRTFLLSVLLCLLAWVVFTVVTLYTVAHLQSQCGSNRSFRITCPNVNSSSIDGIDDALSCNSLTTAPDAAKNESVCTTFECVTTAARLISAMDFSVDPCTDFFNYACANWNKEHVIPDDRTSISTFEVMADKVQVQLRRLLEEPNTNTTSQSMRKAKKMFASCMNISDIEMTGDTPLRRILQKFGNWPLMHNERRNPWKEPTNITVEQLLATIHKDLNLVIVIDQWVGPDDKDSEKHILQIDQPDFALPSRDHYINPQWASDREAYLQYMIDVAKILGASEKYTGVRNQSLDALQVEIYLANASSPEAERQATRGALYNKLSLAELQAQIPHFNWSQYFDTLLGYPLNSSEPIVAYGLTYLKAATAALKIFTKRQIWNYAMWRVAMEFAPHLSTRYLEARANFHKVLMGVSQQRARWQQCIDFVNDKMGMATGAMFIREHFQPESKIKALEMIHMIREAFLELMDEQKWMDDETASKAKEKANHMNEKIGYPDFLLNVTQLNEEYEALVVDDSVFMINVARLLAFQTKRNLDRLKKPVDPERWTTTGPAIVNAFYNPNKNDIVFPAGILQPPFYSAMYPRSMNFGGIGVVVGHEITHGFDMKGRQFDRYGNLKEWWNNETAKAFYDKAECFKEQYGKYVVEEVGLHIDGSLTLGENIADNGGLKQAYRAYHRWVDRNGPEPMLPGSNLTHDQLFFLNYAQIWCGSVRVQDAMNKISASVHSPGPIRVLGPLSNMAEFSAAFKCRPNSKFNPPQKDKCSLW